MINERDILGTQLIRRNDELALLYEKLRIQDSALTRGEVRMGFIYMYEVLFNGVSMYI